MRSYTTDDLIQLARLGRFGNPEMNQLAASAFIHLKRLEAENKRLIDSMENKGIEFFTVNTTEKQENKE